ncbi:MAG: hypothetical protein IJZ57_10695 [Clostridia bacterium]|nr:hypothetical protein [Clostridia bacterium]
MIYSKSSADYAAKYDLKRCFKSVLFFPLLACGLFLLSLFSTWDTNNLDKEYVYKIFSHDTYETYIIYQYIYAAFGALTGLFSFRFLTSVKMSNVYLSMGISRKQLVKNRIISSAFYMVLASIIPFIVAIILNSIYLTVETGLIKASVFYALVYFGDMLLGFAVASLFTVSVGNFIESGVCSLTALLAPTAVIYLMGYTISNLVNGAALSDYEMFYEFGGFCRTFASYTRRLNPLEYLNSTPHIGYKYVEGEAYNLSGFDYLTVIVWLLVAVGILCLVPKLMEKRKAEIAGALGANKSAVNFTVFVYALISFMLVSGFVTVDKWIAVALCIIIPAMVFIGITALVYRNKKEFIKNLKGTAVVACVMAVFTVTLSTGVFGYFTKTPDPEKIEYAGICPASYEFIFADSCYERTIRESTKVYGPMTDKDDINTILSIHQTVVDGLGKGDDSVCFVYKMKNGKYISRFYRNVSLEGAKASLNVVNTKWYDGLLKDSFTDWDFDYDKEWEKIPEVTPGTTQYEETEIGWKCDYIYYKEKYNLGEIYVYGKTLNESVILSEKVSSEEMKEFRTVFAQELFALTPDEIFSPEEKAMYHIRVRLGEEESYGGPSMQNIPVYKSMKKTVEFLTRHNISFDSLAAEDVVEVRLLTPKPTFASINMRSEKSTAISYLSAEFMQEHYVSRETYYSDYGHTILIQEIIKDKKLIEKYFNSYRSYYSYSGDNGAFVMFVFKDGSDLVAYIPEKEL